jgi:hypothetical protein
LTSSQTLAVSGVVSGYPVGPYTLVGAASIQAALSDASDASYVQTDDSGGFQLALTFPVPSWPSQGYLVQSLQIKLRRSVNTAGLYQRSPFHWWRLEANDYGAYGTGVAIGHHERVMGPELTGNMDGTTAIQNTTGSVISWFSDGWHVRDMHWGDERIILLVYPGFQSGVQMRLYKADLIVNYNTLPVATVNTPPDPVNSSKPNVSWSFSDVDNELQTRARIVIVKPGTPSDTWPYGVPGQAQYQPDGARVKAWDSGDIYTNGTSVDVPVGLTNGQQYYAYVRVWGPATASTEQRSLWYYKIFTVTATGPANPTFTVTTDPANARTQLNIQEGSTSSPHAAYYEVERLDPGEVYYKPVRNGTQVATYVGVRLTGTGVGWAAPDRAEFNTPNGLQVTWRGKLTDYTPVTACTLISKGTATGNQRGWIFRVRTDGKLEFQWSTAGTAYNITATSSAASAVTDNTEIWFRATVVSNTNPWSVIFEKSTNGTTWTAVGTTVTGAGPQLIFNETGQMYLGGIYRFTSEPAIGLTYEAIVSSAGTVVAHPMVKGQPQLTSVMIDETGNTWTFTSGANGYNQAELVVYDYEAPFGAAVTYEARAWRHDTDVVPTSWVSASGGPWTLAVSDWWLKDPLDPTNNMIVKVVECTHTTQKPLSATLPVGSSPGYVTHSGARGDLVDATFRLLSMAEFDAFRGLMFSGRTLLFQTVLGHQWFVQPGSEIPYEFMKAAPTVGEMFPIRHAHLVQMKLIEVEAP